MLLREFENILSIKRGKMISALKIEQIYEKIHLIETMVENCTKNPQDTEARPKSLSLDQLKEFAKNLGAL